MPVCSSIVLLYDTYDEFTIFPFEFLNNKVGEFCLIISKPKQVKINHC
jgi:hypothetical protein